LWARDGKGALVLGNNRRRRFAGPAIVAWAGLFAAFATSV
jgi:hypothetical protein